jgi:hypothetical protein
VLVQLPNNEMLATKSSSIVKTVLQSHILERKEQAREECGNRAVHMPDFVATF